MAPKRKPTKKGAGAGTRGNGTAGSGSGPTGVSRRGARSGPRASPSQEPPRRSARLQKRLDDAAGAGRGPAAGPGDVGGGPAAGPAAGAEGAGGVQGACAARQADEVDENEGSRPETQADETPEKEIDELMEARFATLFEVQRDTEIAFQGQEVRFRVKLRVHTDENPFKSRLGYSAGLFLVRRAAAEQAGNEAEEQVEEVDAEERVGYIHAWRIDKPTADFPGKKTIWTNELLTGDPEKNEEIAPELKETALCIQALFNDSGEVREEIIGKQKDDLKTESLIFIQMVYIFERFQRNGFLGHALARYHELLAVLPEWYAFTGNIVLCPCVPDDARGDSWDGWTPFQVEKRLTKAYRTHGQYEVWGRNQRVYESKITVMGRYVEAEEEDEDE